MMPSNHSATSSPMALHSKALDTQEFPAFKTTRWVLALLLSAICAISFTGCAGTETQIDNTIPTTIESVNLPESKPALEDSFYYYTNYDELSQAEIPADSGFYSQINNMETVIKERIADLITEARETEDPSDDQKIAVAFYDSLMNDGARNTSNLEPVREQLDAIESATTIDELMLALAAVYPLMNSTSQATPLVNLAYTQNPFKPRELVVTTGNPDIGMNIAMFVDNTDSDSQAIYKDTITTYLVATGYDQEQAEAISKDLISLFNSLADTLPTSGEAINVENYYERVSFSEFSEYFSNMDMAAFIDALGLSRYDNYMISNPTMVETINGLLTDDNLELLKEYVRFTFLWSLAPVASHDLEAIRLDFNHQIMGIDPNSLTSENVALDKLNQYLPQQIGQLYIDKYFSESEKEGITKLSSKIVDAYKKIIREQDWMSWSTKQAALSKLNAIDIAIGYPDNWNLITPPLTPETISSEDPLSNLINIAQTTFEFQLKQFKRFESYANYDYLNWIATSPQTVNAYYNPTTNSIVVLAGMLQPPFYVPDQSISYNLGAIGAVIAHEISHAFDSTGALFDSSGSYKQWWTDEELSVYYDKAQAIIDYYDNYEIAGHNIDGTKTLEENIADLGALTAISLVAEDNGYNLKEMYSAYAKTWQILYSQVYLEYILAADNHAPDPARIDLVLPSTDTFYDVYNIEPGDGMYVAEEDRVGIWRYTSNE